MDKDLSCQCGNEIEFIAITTVKFACDSKGEKTTKLNEQTIYECYQCKSIVQVEQPDEDNEQAD